jgi:hypothetical protein
MSETINFNLKVPRMRRAEEEIEGEADGYIFY